MPKEISYEEAVKQIPVYGMPRNECIAYTNQVDPAHLLQVIRDMDRRITDLERKLEQNGRQL